MNLFYIAHWYFTRPDFLKSFFRQCRELLSARRFLLGYAKAARVGVRFPAGTTFANIRTFIPLRRLQQFPHAAGSVHCIQHGKLHRFFAKLFVDGLKGQCRGAV